MFFEIEKINNGLHKIEITKRTEKSFVAAGLTDVVNASRVHNLSDKFRENDIKFQKNAEGQSVITGNKEQEEIMLESSENKLSLVKNGTSLLTMKAPVFEEYDITRMVGGEATERKTVDGIKSTVSGGDTEFIRKSIHATLEFEYDDDIFFGLGSHEEGYECLNGHFFPLIQENMRISVPVVVSNKGYGFLVDNGSFMTFDFTQKGKLKLYIDCAENTDIYFFTGTTTQIYRNYRLLTGETPMLPKWACGYIQSKERYENQDELVEVVKEYRKRQVPLDCIVQDWLYWGDNLWGEKILDKRRYPDLKCSIDKIHEMGAHIMISIWPNMSGNGVNQTEFRNNNLLLKDGSVYDAFSEKGRDMYWRQAKEGLWVNGIDAWWCDSSEPYDANWEGESRRPFEESVRRSVTEFKKYIDDSKINLYSMYHSGGIYVNQRKESDKRVINLTRSGFAGQHRYGTVAWSGDISASWETLKKQIHILQNYIATGEAYWNSDIGGFFVKNGNPWFCDGKYDNGVADEGYRELYTRWLQFAGFTPVMRSHGTDTPREIWRFGEEGTAYYDAIKAAIELRYRLMPYFYSVNAMVTLTGEMPVKPLAIAFCEDEEAAEFFDEYIYGNELLICPIYEPGITIKTVYLPKGTWFDLYTKERLEGGKKIEVNVSIDRIPVFVKDGAIIPTTCVMQYADEIKDAPVKLEIYGTGNGCFDLYSDAGDGYDYEKGEYSLLRIEKKEGEETLSINELGKGNYAPIIEVVHI